MKQYFLNTKIRNFGSGSARGYTLVEVMVVAVIVLILGKISIGYYGEQVKTGYRSEGKNALMQLANAMERFKTENNTYEGTHASGVPIASFFPSTAPLGSVENAQYNLTIETTDTTYELTATPIADTHVADDGTLTLSYTGAKTYAGERGWE